MKIPTRIAFGVVGLLLAGCSNSVAGQANPLSYLPVDPETVVLQPISTSLSERVLALSPDGRTVIVTSDEFGVCAVPVEQPQITDADACAGEDNGSPAGIAAVEFNSAGTMALMRQDFARTFRGDAWIFDITTGKATPIELADGPVDDGEGFLALTWNLQRDEIVGISFQVTDGSPVQNIVRIDPEDPTAQILGEPLGEDEGATGQIESAGERMVYTVYEAGEPISRLITVDLADGNRSEGQIDSGGADAGVQNYLLSISSDGGKVLMQQIDDNEYEVRGVVEVDLQSGDSKLWAGSEGLAVTTAAYSPDGAQVLVVGRHRDGQEYGLLLYSAAGAELKDLGAVAESVAPQSRLRWSPRNTITVELPSSVGARDPIGWQLGR